jgi:hypothetical protein
MSMPSRWWPSPKSLILRHSRTIAMKTLKKAWPLQRRKPARALKPRSRRRSDGSGPNIWQIRQIRQIRKQYTLRSVLDVDR